jgi:hypothetical protein
MLVAALIISAELIVLFRLALPDMIAFFETRHNEVYGVSDSDPRLATILNNPTIIEGE